MGSINTQDQSGGDAKIDLPENLKPAIDDEARAKADAAGDSADTAHDRLDKHDNRLDRLESKVAVGATAASDDYLGREVALVEHAVDDAGEPLETFQVAKFGKIVKVTEGDNHVDVHVAETTISEEGKPDRVISAFTAHDVPHQTAAKPEDNYWDFLPEAQD